MMQAGSTHNGAACNFFNQEATEKQTDDSGSNTCLPGQAQQLPLGISGDGVCHYMIWSATWPQRNLALQVMGPALPCTAHFLPPSALFMQPIVFLKAIVPFTSSIIDLLADTLSVSSLSNGRHPPSFHPSFFFSGVSVPPFISLGFHSPHLLWVSVPFFLVGFSPLWGFSPPSSLMGFQSPFISHGVSVPLRLSWGFCPPSSLWGFSPPFVSMGFRSPFISMGFIPPWGFQSPSCLHFSLLCLHGPLPFVSVQPPPFLLDKSAYPTCIQPHQLVSPLVHLTTSPPPLLALIPSPSHSVTQQDLPMTTLPAAVLPFKSLSSSLLPSTSLAFKRALDSTALSFCQFALRGSNLS
jgi:hypothetical protein